VAARLTVTVRRVLEDGSGAAVDGELAAALADSAEQFAGLLTWAAEESGYLDHGEREEAISRELERRGRWPYAPAASHQAERDIGVEQVLLRLFVRSGQGI